ncbi:MAG: SRPBCC domain-containing protein [Gaiellaceae bacterium]
MNVDALYAIRKDVFVRAPVERAWDVFAERLGDWWPLATHSLGGERAETAMLTPERIYERWADGAEHTWGRVLVWEPPHRVVFTWEVGEDSGNEVEVVFVPEGEGTRVELEHRGWESGTRESWESYDGGWAQVLARFVDSVREPE